MFGVRDALLKMVSHDTLGVAAAQLQSNVSGRVLCGQGAKPYD
jgi:hypothetical protein